MTETALPPMATPRIAAGALFTDANGRVLLVQTTYKHHWDIPGGYVEPGESPLQACRREVEEELGIAPPISRLLVVDWAPIDDEGDKILFIFDAGTVDEAELPQTPGTEIAGWSYITPDAIEQYVPDRLAKRIHAAVNARQGTGAAYAEYGVETHHPV